MIRRLALAALALAAAAATAEAAPDRGRTPFWDAGPVAADPGLSLPFYPVAQGAARPCIHAGAVTSDPALVAACMAAWDVYQNRANFMVAAMRKGITQQQRDALCDGMAALLDPGFTHTQAPKDLLPDGRGGVTFTGKAGLVAGCRGGEMFDVTGFKAFAIWLVASGPHRATVTACYIQDQVGGANSPTGDHFPDGRPATYRHAIEQVSREGKDDAWETDVHNAHDVPKEAVFRSCRVPPPAPR